MLLINGDASQETIDSIQDYLFELLSGNPTSQWRIPIVPSGQKKGEGGEIKWIQLSGNNKEMEYQNWLDMLISAICSLFGTSIDDLGLHSQKSQPMFEGDSKHKYSENKSRVLGNVLGYLQSYLNRIIATINPDYELEFVGYECEDPKQVFDLAKGEVETYKTLNEMREEKGLKPLEHDWADIPQSPQAVQLYMGSQGGMSGMEDMGDIDGMGEDEGEGADFGEDDNGDFGEETEGRELEEGDFGEDTSESEDGLEKSFRRDKSKRTIRIVV